MKYTPPIFSLISVVEAMKRPDETIEQAAERCMTEEAMYRADGSQAQAATILGISRRVMNYRIAKLRTRPVDQRKKDTEEPEPVPFPSRFERGAIL
jgi:DNA-binding NtrC family response regulator